LIQDYLYAGFGYNETGEPSFLSMQDMRRPCAAQVFNLLKDPKVDPVQS
jgi:hypothetical protein